MVTMATNRCVLLFYTILLKLKLVSHLLSNRHEIFTKASLIILLKKSGFHIWITTSGVELRGDNLWNCKLQWTRTTLAPHSSTSEVDIQKWKPLFFKEAFMKISCLLDNRWPTSFRQWKIARRICLLPWIPFLGAKMHKQVRDWLSDCNLLKQTVFSHDLWWSTGTVQSTLNDGRVS